MRQLVTTIQKQQWMTDLVRVLLKERVTVMVTYSMNVAFVAVQASLKALAIATATSLMSAVFAVATVLPLALATVAVTFSTLVVFAVATAVHVLVWELQSLLAATLPVDLQHGLMYSLQQHLEMHQAELLKQW